MMTEDRWFNCLARRGLLSCSWLPGHSQHLPGQHWDDEAQRWWGEVGSQADAWLWEIGYNDGSTTDAGWTPADGTTVRR